MDHEAGSILLDRFRQHYNLIESGVLAVTSNTSDLSTVSHLGDDIDEYTSLFNQVFSLHFTFKRIHLI